MINAVSEQKDDFEWKDDYYKGPTKVHSQNNEQSSLETRSVLGNQTGETRGWGRAGWWPTKALKARTESHIEFGRCRWESL